MTAWTDNENGGTVWSDDEAGAADGTLTSAQIDIDADKIRIIDATDNRPKQATIDAIADAIGPTIETDSANSSFTQSGSGLSATNVQDAIVEVDANLDAHIADTTAAHAASAIAFTPAGSIAATDVQAAVVEVDGDVTAHVTDIAGAHAASAISVTPAGSIAATDVQAALEEVAAGTEDIASTSDVSKGDALVGVKRTNTGAVGHSLHVRIEASVINVKADFGATGDGTTDDTAAIQAALDGAGPGQTVFFPQGTYVTGSLLLDDFCTLVGEGRGTILSLKNGTNDYILKAFGKQFLDVRDMYLFGNKANNTGGGGMLFTSACSNVTVRGCLFTDAHAAFIMEGTGSQDLLFADNFITNSIAAVSLSEIDGVRCSNNRLKSNGNNAANAYQINLSSCRYASVANNVIQGIGDSSGDGGVRVSNLSQYITVTGNTIINCSRGLMVVSSAAGTPADISLLGNVIRDSQFEGILCSGNHTSNIVRVGIRGNHVVSSGLAGAGYDAIRCDGPIMETVISGNVLNTMTGWAVRVSANGFGTPNWTVLDSNMSNSTTLGAYSIVSAAQVIGDNW